MASLINEAAASSSSSSLPPSSTDHQNHYTYQVFLSFRGPDTRFSFTDHLYTALVDGGISTFIQGELRRGEEISSALVKAIEESRVSIIVFSQNFASSRWCLDELVKILECRKSKKRQEVIPVFYKVEPSDIQHQIGAFGEAFATLDQCKYKDRMDNWKAALQEAADLSGWPLKYGESEAKFIKKIVGELRARVVNPSCEWHVTAHPDHYTNEVFLSFHGEDTRYNFTDHLHTALRQGGIKTFRDDKLSRGEDIQELLKRIEESRVSVVVFSQNYASSRWCLAELVQILDCKKSRGQKFRAVFYKVAPSDVRHQTGAFGDAFAKIDQCTYKDSIGKWRNALVEAADLSGWKYEGDRYESEFINDIVEELSTQVVNPSCKLPVEELST